MQNKIQFLLFLLFVIIWGGCKIKNSENQTTYKKIKDIADAYVYGSSTMFPENYSNIGLEVHNNSGLSDNSLFGIKQWHSFIDSLYQEFLSINKNFEVNSKEWFLYGYLKEALERSIQIRQCKNEYLSINHLSGWQVTFLRLADFQPVGNEKNRNDALERWSKLPLYVNNEIETLRKGLESGYSVPRDIVELVINQIERLYDTPPNESGFYSPASRDSTLEFKSAWLNILKTSVYPSLLRYKEFLQTEYLPQSRKTLACTDLPGGNNNYEAFCRYFTSVERNTKEVIETSEYRLRLNQSKLKLHGQEKYGTDSIPKILEYIYKDSLYYFKSTEEILGYVNERLNSIKKACESTFDNIPLAEIVIESVPVHLEDHQGSYYMPSIDNPDIPSVYAINLKKSTKRLKVEVETELFHETFPGHHMQLSYEKNVDSIHDITKLVMVNGFNEGWASYAQILAEEMDLYSSGFSRYVVLGRSSMISYLEAKLHSGAFTKEDAIKYLIQNGVSSEQRAKSIIYRMVVWPGQYQTYETGLIEILELREKAKLSLGAEFNIKEFHQIVLEGGSMPLPMLREKINWWIQSKMS